MLAETALSTGQRSVAYGICGADPDIYIGHGAGAPATRSAVTRSGAQSLSRPLALGNVKRRDTAHVR